MAFLEDVRKKVLRIDVPHPPQEGGEAAREEYRRKMVEHEALVREMEAKLNPLCNGCRHMKRGAGFDLDSYLMHGQMSLFHRCSLGGDVYAEGSGCVMREVPVGCRDCDHCQGIVGTILGGTVIVACGHGRVSVNGNLIPLREVCEHGRDRKVSDAVMKVIKENIMKRAGSP